MKLPYDLGIDSLPEELTLSDWCKCFGLVYETVKSDLKPVEPFYLIPGVDQLFCNKSVLIKYIADKYGAKRQAPPKKHIIPQYKWVNDSMYPIRLYRYTFSAGADRYVIPKEVRANLIDWDKIAVKGTHDYFCKQLLGKSTVRVWRWLEDCNLKYLLCGKKKIIFKKDLMAFLSINNFGQWFGCDLIETNKRKYNKYSRV